MVLNIRLAQSPNPESLPPSTVAGSSAPTPAGGLDPRQRPAIVCIAPNEFLIASHTGNTTLGVFVTETGEPCRGTLEWSSNLRSMCTQSLERNLPTRADALLTRRRASLHHRAPAQQHDRGPFVRNAGDCTSHSASNLDFSEILATAFAYSDLAWI